MIHHPEEQLSLLHHLAGKGFERLGGVLNLGILNPFVVRGHELVSLDREQVREIEQGSSRAQARTVLGREFPLATLSMVAGGPSSTIPYVSCAPSKIPDIEFSPVRLQAVASLDQPYPA